MQLGVSEICEKASFQCNYHFRIIFWESFQFRNFEIKIRVEREVISKRLFN